VARVGFILKADSEEAQQLLGSLAPWLIENAHNPVCMRGTVGPPQGVLVVEEDAFSQNADLVVVLGGDGTMLGAAVLVAEAGIPVLGINLGRLGFLTPFDPKDAQQAIGDALSGSLKQGQHMRLSVTHVPKNGPPITRAALNDAVIHQSSMARLVELSAFVDDVFVATYRADGLIAATPTGSTAYNLAAGGPIVMARHHAMVLTPICAHALTNRPLVVDASCTVSLTTEAEGVVVTLDGQWARTIEPGDRIDITCGARPLVTYQSNTPYFDILREKLHWGRGVEKHS